MVSKDSAARFRPATDFPKSVSTFNRAEADAVYEEMRACLIFTNRSRGQLIRRNEEHKNSAIALKTKVNHLQTLVHQLTAEVQLEKQESVQIVAALQEEIGSMTQHLDHLSEAFEIVGDVADQSQQWSFVASPSRFFRFLRAVKAIVLWWREEQPTAAGSSKLNQAAQPASQPPKTAAIEDQDNPRMRQDPASLGRSLLDD